MTDIIFGDKMGSNVMKFKPFSYQENSVLCIYLNNTIIFFFSNGLQYNHGTHSTSGENKFCLSVCLALR